MLSILAISLFACTDRPEVYPDAWSSAAEVCSPETGVLLTVQALDESPSEDCAARLSEDLGDPDELLVSAAALLFRFDLDPWFYDMTTANIEGVDFGLSFDDEDPAASYDRGTGIVTLHRLGDDPLGLLVILVHEAGHGRPNAPNHSRCTAGPYKGSKVCDRGSEGANGAGARVVEALIGLDGDDWSTHRARSLAALEEHRIE
jgi:hypothetical protein